MRANSDSIRRVLDRTAHYNVQPPPPRGLSFQLGVLSWEKPADTAAVTHYNIYADNETNLVRRIPAGQQYLQDNLTASQVFVKAYNAYSDLESSPAFLKADIAPIASGGGTSIYLTGPKTVETIQAAVNALDAAGAGGEIFLGAGNWLFDVSLNIPSTSHDITITGTGNDTVFSRTANMATGHGMVDVYGTGFTLRRFKIDGGVTTSVGISSYSDPMATVLTTNTSIWIHGGAKRTTIEDFMITHTGGYAVLIDATTGFVDDTIINNYFGLNNRPHKFGPAGDERYGSWTGGIFYISDGTNYACRGFRATNLKFRRQTGNCIWGWGYAFGILHTGVEIGNVFMEDYGLDGIEVGNSLGPIYYGISSHRGGFLHSTDSDTPAPLTNPATISVAFDATGVIQGMTLTGMTVVNHNGEACDLDGVLDSTISGFTLANSMPGDVMYTLDQVASFGPTKGIQTGNSFYDKAGRNNTIQNGNIIGFNTNAIVLKNAKYNLIQNIRINHPATASGVPIEIICYRGETQTYAAWLADSSEHRSFGNVITNNLIYYPAANFAIAEVNFNDGTNSYPFNATDVNTAFNNRVLGAGNYGEWKKESTSGSASRLSLPTNDPTVASLSQNLFQREGFGSTAALKFYAQTAALGVIQLMQLSDGAFLNVSVGGTGGSVATGARTTLAWPDSLGTSKVAADGFLAFTNTTYADADADLLDATWVLFRRDSVTGNIQKSVTVTGGHRDWTDLVAAGGSASSYVIGLTLTTGSTNMTSPATPLDGDLLTVFLAQDATGGRAVTWSVDFKILADFLLDDSASTTTTIQFTGRSGKWWMTNANITRATYV